MGNVNVKIKHLQLTTVDTIYTTWNLHSAKVLVGQLERSQLAKQKLALEQKLISDFEKIYLKSIIKISIWSMSSLSCHHDPNKGTLIRKSRIWTYQCGRTNTALWNNETGWNVSSYWKSLINLTVAENTLTLFVYSPVIDDQNGMVSCEFTKWEYPFLYPHKNSVNCSIKMENQ